MLDSKTEAHPSSIEATQIAAIAKARAHPAWVRIITFVLSKPGCIIGGDIADKVGLAQSTASEHLRILKDAGIVTGTIDYPRVCYALDPSGRADPDSDRGHSRPPSRQRGPLLLHPARKGFQGVMRITTITVCDPAMCCSTGICGTDVDQKLVDLAADLDWLKAKGVQVWGFGLSREPAEFAANDTLRQIMQDS